MNADTIEFRQLTEEEMTYWESTTLTDEAVQFVSQKARDLNSIFVIPGTTKIDDIYDANELRKLRLHSMSKNIHWDPVGIIDTNIVSIIVSLLRKTDDSKLSGEYKNVCAIMAYLLHTTIEFNPHFAFHERLNNEDYPSREKDDVNIRVAERLPAQIFADLAMGVISKIPQETIKEVHNRLANDTRIQTDIKNTKYGDRTIFESYLVGKIIYANLLKAIILKRESKSVTDYLNWNLHESISGNWMAFGVTIFGHTQTGILKGIDSSNSASLIPNMKNAAIDIAFLDYVARFHSHALKNNRHSLALFISRDEKLLAFAPDFFASDITKLTEAFSKYFVENEIQSVINAFHQHQEAIKKCDAATRKNHKNNIKNNIDTLIAKLERELTNTINSGTAP